MLPSRDSLPEHLLIPSPRTKRRARWVMFYAVLIIAALVLWFMSLTRQTTVRYAVEVAAMVDGQPANGRAVWEMTLTTFSFLYGGEPQASVRGEAFRLGTVEPPLFVLRRGGAQSSDGGGAFIRQCELEARGRDSYAAIHAALSEFTSCILPHDRARLSLVRIDNPRDPATVHQTEYGWAEPGDANCGQEVCLVAVKLYRTDEELSSGIRKLLPWVPLDEPLSPIVHRDDVRPGGIRGGVLYNQDFSLGVPVP